MLAGFSAPEVHWRGGNSQTVGSQQARPPSLGLHWWNSGQTQSYLG